MKFQIVDGNKQRQDPSQGLEAKACGSLGDLRLGEGARKGKLDNAEAMFSTLLLPSTARRRFNRYVARRG